jgi:hypothetical protein
MPCWLDFAALEPTGAARDLDPLSILGDTARITQS